ncbi:MAG: hypothetical protein OXB84_05765 [Halobacteriovoraceae bacterium]|nr:hypothetical protein [Halobacteriovoraceae bacterium]
MGLLYQFPIQENPDDDCIEQLSNGRLTLKSYGLPMIFWGYAASILLIIFFMFLISKEPIWKLIQENDLASKLLGLSAFFLFALFPLLLLGFLFYQKVIQRNGSTLSLVNKVLGIAYWKKTIQLKTGQSLVIAHFMDSPNVAKSKGDARLKGFENRGYYQLFAEDQTGKLHLIDRHSNLREMKKMRELLQKY